MSALIDKASRFAARGLSRSALPGLNESIITFSFDDCPASAIQNAVPLLEAEGWRATIFVACGLCETVNHLGQHISLSDIVEIHNQGHEIADHTYSHISAHRVSTDDYIADIERNQKTLKQLGLPPSRHFAYPFGHVTPSLKRSLESRFETMRGVLTPTHATQDSNLLKGVRVYSGQRYQEVLKQIENAKTRPIWLHLFTHDVRENPSDYGCTGEEFKTVVAAVKDSGISVMTVDKAYRTITERRSAA